MNTHDLAGQIGALNSADYDTMDAYITAAERLMNELHLTEEGRRLKPVADVVTQCGLWLEERAF